MRGTDLVLGEELRREAALQAATYQQALRRYHCRNICPRTLEVGDLLLRRVLSREGLHKLSPMWEGPFKVVHVSRPGSARLETQEGCPSRLRGTFSTFGDFTLEARPSAYRKGPEPVKKANACEACRVKERPDACEKGQCL